MTERKKQGKICHFFLNLYHHFYLRYMKEKIQINIKAHPATTEIHVDMLHISKHLSVITIEKLHVFTVEVILVIRLLAFNENE